jgi:predicted enzyme related to lactoylglutathione lyase
VLDDEAALEHPQLLASVEGHVLMVTYVEVPDIEAALGKAESVGGTRVFGPAPVAGTEVELGQFTDPEGHLIGLHKAAS